jgi:hypothetical protein
MVTLTLVLLLASGRADPFSKATTIEFKARQSQ